MKSMPLRPPAAGAPAVDVVTAPSAGAQDESGVRARARAFAVPLLAGETSSAGESLLEHADAVADILLTIGGSESLQAAAYLSYASAQLNRPDEVIGKAFDDSLARLAIETSKLERVQKRSRGPACMPSGQMAKWQDCRLEA